MAALIKARSRATLISSWACLRGYDMAWPGGHLPQVYENGLARLSEPPSVDLREQLLRQAPTSTFEAREETRGGDSEPSQIPESQFRFRCR